MREVAGKSIGFVAVAVACIGGGILAIYGPHAYNDYFNTGLAVVLILVGLGALGFGGLVMLVEFREAAHARRAHELEVTPRPGPLGPPPPWGMGDIGRVGGAVKEVGDGTPTGGGGVRLMTAHVRSLDAPVGIALLLLATLVALVLKAYFGGLDFAPRP